MKMNTCWLRWVPLALLGMGMSWGAADNRPNFVFILADDMGYGDVQVLNPERCKIPTPNLDQLAKEGMIFTDGHSSSSVCTPTRYSIITGRYNWRSELQSGVLWGMSKPLIPTDRMTVASFLKAEGYQTGCVGKWHLGLNIPLVGESTGNKKADIDYKKPVTHGPNELGFDYFYGIPASLDMPPYVYIENGRFTAEKAPISSGSKADGVFYRSGPKAENLVMDQVLPHLTDKATAFIREKAKQGRPFFLYFPMTGPHTPIIPTAEFKGKTKLGSYGDFCVEVDAMVGKVMKAIEEAGVADNTLILFSADNGCSNAAKINNLEALGHFPSAQFRGRKAEIFEGGHRVPYLVRWPAKIKAGSRSDNMVCLVDFMATCADILGKPLPENAAEDSISMLPAMLGDSGSDRVRTTLVNHSARGAFAIREGSWKLALCSDGGESKNDGGGKKDVPAVQLYDLSTDIGEQNNVQAQHPEVVKRMTALLEKQIADGRSTPGPAQKNDVKVMIFKTGKGGGEEE